VEDKNFIRGFPVLKSRVVLKAARDFEFLLNNRLNI